ncbi:21223_t:CDS:2, partial [Gigaspora rosea]
HYPDLKIDYTTISKILKKTDEYQQLRDNDVQAEKTFRHRSVKYPMLELAMNMWIEWVTTEEMIISESLIKEKCRQFAQALDISEESLAASAPLASLSAERIKLQELLSRYSPENIYNADETGKEVLLLVDNAASHITSGTNNMAEVQDDDEELTSEIEDQQEPKRNPRGRSQGRSQRSNPTRSSQSKRTSENFYLTNVTGEDKTANNNDNVALLLEDLSVETDLELSNNIEEYIQMIEQPAVTEDVLTDKGIIEMVMDEFRDNETDDDDNDEEPSPHPITITEAIEALEKVIRYQEGLDVGKRFDKNGLMMLQKKLKE